MKIYNRQAFLKLPPGVIFAKGQRWSFDSLMVKGESLNVDVQGLIGDFTFRDLVWIDRGKNDAEQFDHLESMKREGASYPVNKDYIRDGYFDEEEIFLVYEREDLVSMLTAFSMALMARF